MIKTWRPVSPPRCNYTTPPYRPTSPVTEIRIWSNARCAQESTSWLGDKRGVTAGGDPSGSRRSISIQNHAYDFSKRRHTLSVSSSWKMPPNRQRTGVIFYFFFGVGESAGEKMKPWHEPADRSLWRRRTRAFYAGSGWETRRKLIVHHGNTAVVLQHPAFTERCVINSITIITSCPVFPPNPPPFFLSHFWF